MHVAEGKRVQHCVAAADLWRGGRRGTGIVIAEMSEEEGAWDSLLGVKKGAGIERYPSG